MDFFENSQISLNFVDFHVFQGYGTPSKSIPELFFPQKHLRNREISTSTYPEYQNFQQSDNSEESSDMTKKNFFFANKNRDGNEIAL